MVKKTRVVRPTLLIVGEGDCEEAFLKHLRNLYCADLQGVTVTIRNAHGKGPENVLDHTCRQARQYSYDRVVTLMDSDIPWTNDLTKTAKKANVELIGSKPCLEGLLLKILHQAVSAESPVCKKSLQKLLGADMTERKHYEQHFPKALLETARNEIPELGQLIACFEGM